MAARTRKSLRSTKRLAGCATKRRRPALLETAALSRTTKGDRSIARLNAEAAPSRDGPRVNVQINAPTVRLINEAGEMVGVVNIREALDMAAEAGLDLVEISPNAAPPVCKILDYGKYKYEAQKKKAEARKKQKVIEVKEINLLETSRIMS